MKIYSIQLFLLLTSISYADIKKMTELPISPVISNKEAIDKSKHLWITLYVYTEGEHVKMSQSDGTLIKDEKELKKYLSSEKLRIKKIHPKSNAVLNLRCSKDLKYGKIASICEIASKMNITSVNFSDYKPAIKK